MHIQIVGIAQVEQRTAQRISREEPSDAGVIRLHREPGQAVCRIEAHAIAAIVAVGVDQPLAFGRLSLLVSAPQRSEL